MTDNGIEYAFRNVVCCGAYHGLGVVFIWAAECESDRGEYVCLYSEHCYGGCVDGGASGDGEFVGL